ncbi:hypothetical protein LTR66_005483, partial [Elasticomyces elasticus]
MVLNFDLDTSRRPMPNNTLQNQPTSSEHTESTSDDPLAEADEPPDDRKDVRSIPLSVEHNLWSTPTGFTKSLPPLFGRRESLLTRQIHANEPDSHPDEEELRRHLPVRGPSTVSSWSRSSVASTAELTSDDGVTSPGTRASTPSPPLPPTISHMPLPIMGKTLDGITEITGHVEDTIAGAKDMTEKKVEADLGRRRCITFACGKSEPQELAKERKMEVTRPEPAKRTCSLRFVCPTRAASKEKAANVIPRTARHPSPPPSQKAMAVVEPETKVHRGSDSTVKNESPRSTRKATPSGHRRKYSEDSDFGHTEAVRFHEFASSEEEVEEWVQEATCHRSRLTINDTLKKEIAIRKLGEEVEEEALDDEAELDMEAGNHGDDGDVDEEEDLDEDDEAEDDEKASNDEATEEDVSDAGFQTDDEEGFAVSDDESESDSDNEWWHPGKSTAATSTDQLEHIRSFPRRTASESSVGS